MVLLAGNDLATQITHFRRLQVVSMLLLSFLLALILCQDELPRPGPDWRLVEFAPNVRQWVPESTLFDLRVNYDMKYLDVTNEDPSFRYEGPFPDAEFPKVLHQQTTVSEISALLKKEGLESVVRHLSTSFKTRYFKSEEGAQATEWLHEHLFQFMTTLPAKRRDLVTLRLVPNKDFDQDSLVFSIAGSDPTLQDELVIMGGHIDSIAKNKEDAPGADDDATGVAVCVHLFETILKGSTFVPKRTIQFMAFAGEEGGLLGSKQIAQQYHDEKKKVVSMMNLDMCGSHSSSEKPSDWCSIMTDFTDGGLNDFVNLLVKEYTRMEMCQPGKCGYACSDHASFERHGYPATFPFEATTSPVIHTSSDKIEHVDFDMVLEYAKMAVGYVVELGVDVW